MEVSTVSAAALSENVTALYCSTADHMMRTALHM
jgi:hypothetical protein